MLTALKDRDELMGAGVLRDVRELSPSSPWALDPQHKTVPDEMPQA
jgi:hypothetical protein